MIDLIGAGTHINYFREKSSLNFSNLICICFQNERARTDWVDAKPPKKWISFLENPDAVPWNNADFYFIACGVDSMKNYPSDSIENLNRSTHNSPIKLSIMNVSKKIIPKVTFSETCDTENPDVLESCLEPVLKSKIAWVNDFDVIKTVLPNLIQAIDSCLIKIPLRRQHSLEEQMNYVLWNQLANVSRQKE